MVGSCHVADATLGHETRVEILYVWHLVTPTQSRVTNASYKLRTAGPPLPAPLSAERRQGAGSPMSTACLSDFRIGSPVLMVHSTAWGCCVQWLQHLYSLDLVGRLCTRFTATLEYGA